MAIPEPRSLLLREAPLRVADRCGVPIEKAKGALDRAFREHSLVAYDSHFAPITDWEFSTIDWDKSSIERAGPSVNYTTEGVSVFREHLDDWTTSAAPKPQPRFAAGALATIKGESTVDREWPPLLDGIKHIQRITGTALGAAARDLQTLLYEGRVKSRVARRPYRIPRHDGIEPSDWYHVTIFQDGSVEFRRDPAVPPPPRGPWCAPLSEVEVCWADVLRYWEPEAQSASKPPRLSTPPRRPSRERPFWPDAREAAITWLDENGYPLSGDGGQTTLEEHIARWLSERGHKAAPSTIRVHVRAWIDEFKSDRLSAGEAD